MSCIVLNSSKCCAGCSPSKAQFRVVVEDPNALNVCINDQSAKDASKILYETFIDFGSFVDDVTTAMETKLIPNMHMRQVLWWFSEQNKHKLVKFYHNGITVLDLEKNDQAPGFMVTRSVIKK